MELVLQWAWVIVSFLLTLYINTLRKDNKDRDVKIASLEQKIAISEAKFITEPEMKKAIKEAMEPYGADQQEIKFMVRELNDHVLELTRDMAVHSAIAEFKRNVPNSG